MENDLSEVSPTGPAPGLLERLSTSRWGTRAALVLLALTAALVTTFPILDALRSRGREAGFWDIYVGRLIEFLPWAIAAEPLARSARAILRRWSSSVVRVAALLLLTALAGTAVASTELYVAYRLELPFTFGPGFPGRGGPEGWRPRGDRPRPRASEQSDAERESASAAEDGNPGADTALPGEPAGGGATTRSEAERSRADRRWRGRFDRRGEFTFKDLLRRGLQPAAAREWLFAWAVLALSAGAFASVDARRRERRTLQLESELSRAQLDSLKSQLHPHFLFNALHSVGGLVRTGEERGAIEALSALGDLLRRTLDLGANTEIPLHEDLAVIESYLEIEEIRFGDRLSFAVEYGEDVRHAQVPALTTLALVENAVRHGIAPREEGGRVLVSARKEGEELILEVCDDGPGYPHEVLDSPRAPRGSGGIGLSNLERRLAAYAGPLARLELDNLPSLEGRPGSGGARALVRLPLSLTSA